MFTPPPRPSSRTSAYSLQSLSRPSSNQVHPPSTLHNLTDAAPNLRRLSEQRDQSVEDDLLPQDVDRYDRIWSDLAARMGELDTSTRESPSDIHLISEAHAKAMEQLRETQIRLKETWAGSESRLDSSQSSLLTKLANSATEFVLLNCGS